MNSQPIIIEQIAANQLKQNPSHMEGELFYEVLDQTERYDSIATQIRKMHQNAMLDLAAIKFIDPNSLSTNAHRCLPAFLKTSEDLQLKYGYSAFAQADEALMDEESLEQQQAIEKECLDKQAAQVQKQEKGSSQTLRQAYIEKEILFRFNVLNQQDKIVATSSRFKRLLEKLMELSKLKHQIDQRFTALQSKR